MPDIRHIVEEVDRAIAGTAYEQNIAAEREDDIIVFRFAIDGKKLAVAISAADLEEYNTHFLASRVINAIKTRHDTGMSFSEFVEKNPHLEGIDKQYAAYFKLSKQS